MHDIHEMYKELYTAINALPLPTAPDDPEPAEPEEYVEPEWVAQLDSCGRDEDMDQIWPAPEFGARKREWHKAFNAQLLFIRKCGGSLEVPEELRGFEF